jgi:Spy/CpxP family protein refolding chaperone
MNRPSSLTLRRLARVATIAVAASLGAVAMAAPHGGPGMLPMAGRGLQRMLDAAEATPDQRTRIEQIAAAARADLMAGHQASQDLRRQFMAAFAQPTLDPALLESLRQQMLAEHDRTSQRVTQAMLEAGNVLTPEQRQKIAQDMAQRGDRMRHHGPERGGDRGPR